MRQKLVSALLVLVLGASLPACSDDEPDAERDDPVGTTLPEEMTPETREATVP